MRMSISRRINASKSLKIKLRRRLRPTKARKELRKRWTTITIKEILMHQRVKKSLRKQRKQPPRVVVRGRAKSDSQDVARQRTDVQRLSGK